MYKEFTLIFAIHGQGASITKKDLHIQDNLSNTKLFLPKVDTFFFKTDDDYLFEDSIKYFQTAGFVIEKSTYDLASEQNFWLGEENIETEHEKMFKKDGIKIKACIAKNEDAVVFDEEIENAS